MDCRPVGYPVNDRKRACKAHDPRGPPPPVPRQKETHSPMSAPVAPDTSTSTEAAEAAVAAINGSVNQDVTFSLELTQDQKDIRDWVHGFAADVVRPAAHEWDEKEQTPWPIIQ